ncbi:serine hydrolase domain-containing protein [Pelagerythrobacter aerophilus]
MIRHLIAAAALLAPVPAIAQSQQEALDARYDRALAAGYKALFLCSAIANAERAGAERTPESVMQWELTGIQAPLDGIVGELPYEIVRADEGGAQVRHVSVAWAEDMPPRYAVHDTGKGCALLPIGSEPSPEQAVTRQEAHPSAPIVQPKAAALAAALDRGFSPSYGEGARTTAVLVRRRGDTLGERYVEGFGPDTPQRTWSVAKSIAATLIGAAVERRDIDVASSAGLGLTDIDPRRTITIDHLLRMASGRYSDTPGNRTDPLYFGGATVGERAAVWPLIHAPGTVYRYANNDTLMAVKAIEDTFTQHPSAELFARLGMHDTVAETDWQGNYILSSQVWSTARDLATLGQLYLDGGVWNGERILPEGWTRYVSSPSGPQPDRDFGYGAGFWLFNKSEGVPADTFAAMGNRGQYVVIVPSREVVIVRRGEDPPGSGFDIAAFTRDVLAALDN